jgi:hypothetical protein
VIEQEHDNGCCPILRIAAESERMAACGIIAAKDGEYLASSRIDAINVAMIRERYGCAGPRAELFGGCPYRNANVNGFTTDPKVPLLRPPPENGGTYI